MIAYYLQRIWGLRPRRTKRLPGGVRVAYEHPAQPATATFLRAAAADDSAEMWRLLSAETRGLLEGLHASRAAIMLAQSARIEEGDQRVNAVIAPLRAAIVSAVGGPERLGALGVSAARLVDRHTAYVLLLPDFGEERMAREEDWKPAHLLAFVYESREWRIDLGVTAALSVDAELPDPLGPIA